MLNCYDFDCDGGDCPYCDGGGGGCPAGEIEDCNGNCCPETWVGDGYCDDGTWGLVLTCDEWDNDGGDCDGRDNSATVPNTDTEQAIADKSDVLNLVKLHNGFDNHPYVYANKILTPSRDYVLIGSTAGTDYTDVDVINGIEYWINFTNS